MNNVSLVGRLCKDPELKPARNGVNGTLFQLAVDRGVRSSSGDRIVDFVPCSAWGINAEYIARYSRKGDMLSIIGQITTRQSVNPRGESIFIVEVSISKVSLLNPKPQEKAVQAPQSQQQPIQDDGLPF